MGTAGFYSMGSSSNTVCKCILNGNITQYGSTVYIGIAMGGPAL